MELSPPRVAVAECAGLTSTSSPPRRRLNLAARELRLALIGAALVATFLKLTIAFNTFGTNDVAMFHRFGHALTVNGLEWTYRYRAPWADNEPVFNHPPLSAYFLKLIFALQHNSSLEKNEITFPFLLRLPGIAADFLVVLLAMKMSILHPDLRLPPWSLGLFALSPVSLMVSGFHGNTDSVMVLFFVLGAFAALHDRAWLCGLALALASEIKIVPLLFLPVFVFFWLYRGRLCEFLISFTATAALLSFEMLSHVDLLARNVLGYGSFRGLWGITYCLRLTHWPQFGIASFHGLPATEIWIMHALKLLIFAAISVIGWRRRKLDGAGLVHSLGWSFVLFFIFSPGVSAQYLVWLAPFLLFLSPAFYGWVTATSAIFLFFFYNITAHGLPWDHAISTDEANALWGPWSICPWLTLIVGLWVLSRNARMRDPGLRLLSLAPMKDKIDNGHAG